MGQGPGFDGPSSPPMGRGQQATTTTGGGGVPRKSVKNMKIKKTGYLRNSGILGKSGKNMISGTNGSSENFGHTPLKII